MKQSEEDCELLMESTRRLQVKVKKEIERRLQARKAARPLETRKVVAPKANEEERIQVKSELGLKVHERDTDERRANDCVEQRSDTFKTA